MSPEEKAVIDATGESGRTVNGEAGRPEDLDQAFKPDSARAILWRRCLWTVGILCACAGLAFGAVAGFSAYTAHQVKTLTESAAVALAHEDYDGASLSARRALQMDENHVAACKLMAEIGEKGGDVRAVTWRQRVVELAPGSVDALIAYASTAVRFGKRAVAEEALERIDEPDRQRADFQAVSGAVALAGKNKIEAERFYAAAIELAPDNPAYRVDLGTVQSSSEDYFTREAGRRLLGEMQEHPDVGPRALRGLVASHEAAGEFSTALRLSSKLMSHEKHLFPDEIIHLRLLRRTGNPEFAKALADLQTKAKTKANMATVVVTWMNSEGLAAEAVTWATGAFPKLTETPGLRAAVAVSMTGVRRWEKLLELTKSGPWQEAEYGRQAYRARAMREGGQTGLAYTAWKNAVTVASSEPDALVWLAQMASEWDWAAANEEALLAIVGSSSKARSALRELTRRYLADGNTAGLRSLAARLMATNPLDDKARNDYANLSLLLEADVPHALRIARDLFDKHPDDPTYASTYAFALYFEGRSAEALQVLEKLPAGKLEEPGFAAYYGIVLAANHLSDQAERFLQIAREGPLLREELFLVEKSLQKTGNPGTKSE